MKWEIRIEKKAQKELDNIPAKYQKKIIAVLPIIADNPFEGKKMKGDSSGLYSYPIWPYRIIYKMYKKVLIVVIVRFGHRQGIYD